MMKRQYVLWGALLLLTAAPYMFAQSPPAPTNLVAHVSMDHNPSVSLEWMEGVATQMGGGLVFHVFRSVDDSMQYSLRGVAFDKSFRDFDVTTGHSYSYYVTAAATHDSVSAESGPSDTVSVSVAAATPKPKGMISGTVIDSLTGRPLPLVRILFFRTSSHSWWVPQAWTDTAGHYSAVLDTGTYIVNAQPWRILEPFAMMMMGGMHPTFLQYLPEWFDDASEPDQAMPIMVSDSSKFTADFDLMRLVPPMPVQVSGMVTRFFRQCPEGRAGCFPPYRPGFDGSDG